MPTQEIMELGLNIFAHFYENIWKKPEGTEQSPLKDTWGKLPKETREKAARSWPVYREIMCGAFAEQMRIKDYRRFITEDGETVPEEHDWKPEYIGDLEAVREMYAKVDPTKAPEVHARANVIARRALDTAFRQVMLVSPQVAENWRQEIAWKIVVPRVLEETDTTTWDLRKRIKKAKDQDHKTRFEQRIKWTEAKAQRTLNEVRMVSLEGFAARPSQHAITDSELTDMLEMAATRINEAANAPAELEGSTSDSNAREALEKARKGLLVAFGMRSEIMGKVVLTEPRDPYADCAF